MRRIVHVAVLLLVLGSCSQKSRPLPPSLHSEFIPLEPKQLSLGLRIERIAEERVLTIGQTCSPSQPSPLRVRLDQIDVEKKACLLQVEDTETGHESSGWAQEGRCASFAPEDVGTGGLEIVKILPDKATLQFNSCRYVELRDGKPADE